jgi:hypothetical protein
MIVDPSGPATEAGIQRGGVILQVNRQPSDIGDATSAPGPADAIRLRRVLGSETRTPFTAVIHIARLHTGVLGRTVAIHRIHQHAANIGKPHGLRQVGSNLLNAHAQLPRLTLPPFFNCSMTLCAVLEGIAKPMPMLPPKVERIWLLMPIGSPRVFTSAPPELP